MRVNVIGKPGNFDGLTARVFDSVEAPVGPEALEQLLGGVRGADLAAPPVVLPDFHHKATMEMPSSIAVATLGTIRPTFTSSSVNCGMALIALDADEPSPEGIEAFFRGVRERYPYPPTRRAELARSEVEDAATRGADFAVDRYGLDPGELERVEERGCLDVHRFGGAAAIRRTIPWLSAQLSRLRFGTIGPSNHFVELQRVEEVLQPVAARRLGVEEGQLTLQYHGGGGVLASQMGRIFQRRKKMSRQQAAQMRVLKPWFHLAHARSLAELRRRLDLFFTAGAPPVEIDGPEGHRMMLANAAAMNYGFAFRLATYANLRAIASATLGVRGSRLVVDSPHNSIYEELVNGAPALVHRHNASRAYPASMMEPATTFAATGQAVLVPGTDRTSSYLCVAGERAERSLYSACHGAGTMVADFELRGLSKAHPSGRRTLEFGYGGGAPVEKPQLDDRGVDEALAILTANELATPVARMRPLGVLH